MSVPVLDDGAGIKYLKNSYKAVGQDGQHFNGALTDAPMNTAAPSNVIQALYEMSDHLPVTARFILHTTPLPPTSIAEAENFWATGIRVVNPFSDRLTVFVPGELRDASLALRLYDAVGRVIVTATVMASGEIVNMPLPALVPAGLYVLTVTDFHGRTTYFKLQGN